MIERAREPEQQKPSPLSSRELRRKRARRHAVRFALGCGLPTIIAAVYYGFVAAPRYDSEAVVSVESVDDPLGTLEGKKTPKDATLVADFVRAHWSQAKVKREHGSVLHIRVRAGSPAEAQALGREIVAAAEAKVREISAHAQRNPAFLVVVAEPSLPSQPAYPKKLWSIATAFVTSLALVAVLSLLGAAVREHAQF